jgi:FKBP-type peptidyl-prolyl cis-trans isomerase
VSGRIAGAATALVAGAAIALAANEPPKSEGATGANDKSEKKPPLPEFKSSKEKASYVIGLNIGQQILRDFGRSDSIDPDALLRGLKSGMNGDRPLERAGMQEAILVYRQEVIKQDAVRFLEDNKKKEGVKSTASGLQYQVINAGKGKQAKLNDKVRVHYTGTLVNGTKFDSSHDGEGKPAEFEVKTGPGGVVAGWVEGLQLMKEGDKWRFFIPPALGYDDKGSHRDASGKQAVPPHAVMVFELELIKVLD